MPGIHDAQQAWTALTNRGSYPVVKDLILREGSEDDPALAVRSLGWKTCLLFRSTDNTKCQQTIASTRSAYDTLRAHFSPTSSSASAPASNPLGEDLEKRQDDENLLDEIKQDVDRCMPEMDFFRLPATKQMMGSILFVFCKLNPDLSYRQGMHELLAPIVHIVDQDALTKQHPRASAQDEDIETLLDASFIEHDSFTLFSQVMQDAKSYYEQPSHAATENPLLAKSHEIVITLLSQVDPELSQHLQRIGLAPQIFLIRWLRLLFGREFAFDDVLAIWDIIFADDRSLELADHICIVMLLRIRWDLIDCDHNGALALLLHYPPLEPGRSGRALALDALQLRNDFTLSRGRKLIEKYTGRLPIARISESPATRNVSSLSSFNYGKFARKLDVDIRSVVSKEPSEIEAMMRSTMRNLYNRGEQLGIGKAVRSAVEDVHRRAQEIKESRSPGGFASRRSGSGQFQDLSSRLRTLEQRNIRLSNMLESAVSDLWAIQNAFADRQDEQQQASHDADARRSAELERMSLAIGQVQLVQIHLHDSTLPLQRDESDDPRSASFVSGESTVEPSISEKNERSSNMLSASGMAQSEHEASSGTTERVSSSAYTHDLDSSFVVVSDSGNQDEVKTASIDSSKTRNRPSLAEGSYSWILGQAEHDDGKSSSSPSRGKDSPKRPDHLFNSVADLDSTPTTSSQRRVRRPVKKTALESVYGGDPIPD